METVTQGRLTLGEAARRLGTDVDALLQLIYRGQLRASVEHDSGRLLIETGDVERLSSPARTHHSEEHA